MALYDFDSTQVEPVAAFAPLKPGDYLVSVVASEWKKTKAGDGEYIALSLSCLEGTSKGRRLYCNLNLKNKSAEAVQIARATLSSLCRAAGVQQIKDTTQLHGIPVIATVTLRDDRNEVKGFGSRHEKAAEAAATPARPF